MSNRVMLALGEFRFEIGTAAYQNLERQHTYTWSVQDRLGRVGASQFTGRKPGTITLEGTIYPAFRGGLGQIPTMREAAEKGGAAAACLRYGEDSRQVGHHQSG